MSPKRKRHIIHIDEDKCDGCGLCIPACAEGAIQIINGKAKLVKESLCDGVGDCLGECPQGALTVEEREAEEFNEEEVKRHLEKIKGNYRTDETDDNNATQKAAPCTREMQMSPSQINNETSSCYSGPVLSHWPIQLHLISENSSFLRAERYVIAADCTAFSYQNFHSEILKGDVLLLGCPKLDDASAYLDKLTRILKIHQVSQITVATMEVPCCSGFNRIVEMAADNAEAETKIASVVIGINGEIKRTAAIN